MRETPAVSAPAYEHQLHANTTICGSHGDPTSAALCCGFGLDGAFGLAAATGFPFPLLFLCGISRTVLLALVVDLGFLAAAGFAFPLPSSRGIIRALLLGLVFGLGLAAAAAPFLGEVGLDLPLFDVRDTALDVVFLGVPVMVSPPR